MQHDQQDPAIRSRLPLLLPLLALSLFAPWLIDYYEQQRAYQWEQMLRRQWQPMPVVISLPATPREEVLQPPALANANEDVPEWKTIDVPPEPAVAETRVPVTAKPVAKTAEKAAVSAPAAPKPKRLKLKMPENPYQGDVAAWEEAPPLPDLFAPKAAESSRVQFGGKLITDDKVLESNPDANFLDTIKGAEVNISIKTQ